MIDTAHRIVSERRRQISEEGYTPEHDDEHDNSELLLAAFSYLCVPAAVFWPWDAEQFVPSTDPVRNLVISGALLAAEGDRLLRRRQAGLPITGGLVILGANPEERIAQVEGLREIGQAMKNLRP